MGWGKGYPGVKLLGYVLYIQSADHHACQEGHVIPRLQVGNQDPESGGDIHTPGAWPAW